MSPKNLTSLALGLALVAGCDPSPQDDVGPDAPTRRRGEAPSSVPTRLSLAAFDSCGALESYLEDGMVEQINLELDRVLEGGGYPTRGETTGAPGAAAPASDAKGAPPPSTGSGSSAAAPSAVTTTNNQVAGVDEPDFVKNDKTRAFVLSGGRLFSVQTWPPQSLAVRKSLAIDGRPREMFLDEARNRVVVISEIALAGGGVGVGVDAGGGVAPTDPAVGTDLARPAAPCPPDAKCGGGDVGVGGVKLTVVDVKDAANPRLLDAHYFPGRYVNARRIDGAIRLVLTDRFQHPAGVKTWLDAKDPSIYGDKARLTAAFAAQKKENERIIRARTLDDWIPKPQLRRMGNQVVSLGYSCSDFYHSNAPTKSGLVTLATVSIDAPERAPHRISVVAEPGEIYASSQALYVAHPHWWWAPVAGQSTYTYLHKFDISKPEASYVASGAVEGQILNQFSMDEYEGHLRVATTIERWGENAGAGSSSSSGVATAEPAGAAPSVAAPRPVPVRNGTTNRVSVLGIDKGALVVVGKSEELAIGERIRSARFIGPRGFVVTFRDVDPFFTFDLTDPKNPRKIGELKIPGFSSYIHPIGPNHLLTIGTYVPDPTTTGPVAVRTRAVKLEIFDVTDFAKPVSTHVELVGTAQGWSEATNEHKAFNYFPERKLLAIPFQDASPTLRGWDGFTSELRIFAIDPVTGIKPRGAVDLKDVYVANARTSFDAGYSPWVRRSIMATDEAGNDFVYAIADAGVRVANLKAVGTPVATARFVDRAGAP